MDIERKIKLNLGPLLDKLYYAAIFLFPIDSFPIFPTNNVYRPISVIILAVYFFLYTFSYVKRIKKHDFIVFSIGLFILIQTSFTSIFVFQQYSHLPKAITTVFLAFIIVVTTNDFFYRNKDNFPINKIVKTLKFSFLLCAFMGIIQFAGIIGLFPKDLSELFTGFFSYRSTGRMQMLSGEPAMMFRHLLVFLIFFVGVKKFPNRNLFLVFVLFFLLISGSTFGYSVLAISVGLYVLIFKIGVLFKAKFLLPIAIISVLFLFAYNFFLDDYTVNKINLVVDIISNPDTIKNYLHRDGSFFIRFINPIIGFKASAYSYGLGSGIDTYRYLYPKYILSDYPYAMSFFSVKEAVDGVNYITPKSIYSKILCEVGIFAFLAYLWFLISSYFKIKILRTKNHKFFLEVLFVMIVVFGINNDSVIYVNLYFLIYFFYYLLYSKTKHHD